jgi:hypothetical protein
MAAIIFPPFPGVGDIYPAGAGTPGVSQWQWDGAKWNTIPVFVRLNNQQAYNEYTWPDTIGTVPGYQLTDNLADGVLSWEIPGGPFFYLDDISSQFDGFKAEFILTRNSTNFQVDPPSNLIVVLGGIVQTYGSSYIITGFNNDTIQFIAPPAPGATFTAISNREC